MPDDSERFSDDAGVATEATGMALDDGGVPSEHAGVALETPGMALDDAGMALEREKPSKTSKKWVLPFRGHARG